MHTPVLLQEVIEHLNLKQGDVILDATLGCGGHAQAVLEKIVPGGSLIGVDQDEEALHHAESRLSIVGASSYRVPVVRFVKGNFSDVDNILAKFEVGSVNGMVMDLGVSSVQLDNATRGFSIAHDGPLDMRMDRSAQLTAYDVVNRYPEERLAEIIKEYGEERHARSIAARIVAQRKVNRIASTAALAGLVASTVGRHYRGLRIHPATRTFQAIRIEVNQELEKLAATLKKIPDLLIQGGRVCIISFHSLEDRIVKYQFRTFAKNGVMKIITKKPIVASRAECMSNPRSRSAKLRVAERI